MIIKIENSDHFIKEYQTLPDIAQELEKYLIYIFVSEV